MVRVDVVAGDEGLALVLTGARAEFGHFLWKGGREGGREGGRGGREGGGQ